MSYNLLDATKDFLTGSLDFVADHVQKARSDTCKSCPELRKLPMARVGKCNVCGCFMDAKVKLAHASCPQSKWEK